MREIKKDTQQERIVNRIDEVGYVDNFWAFHNYILRLGAIIFKLKKKGFKFNASFGKGKFKKNYYYRPVED